MKRIMHYILYPMWLFLDRWVSFGVYSDDDYLTMRERTTWKYQTK